MSPGQEALREAMRLEQARIYGELQHEHKQPHAEPQRHATVTPITDARRRRSA